MKRIRLQVKDSVSRWLSVQDARMGFHICIVGYLFGILVLLLCETYAYLSNDQVIFVLCPILLHIKPVNAAASRASSSRLK